jgi:ubiquinone/menaquinone biosynthesis C-methylase UbiE
MNSFNDRFSQWEPLLRSPHSHQALSLEASSLKSTAAECFSINAGIPQLLVTPKPEDSRWQRVYDAIAPLYLGIDRAFARVVLGFDLVQEQHRIVSGLPIGLGDRVLEVSPGPGAWQPWLAAKVGVGGALAAVDLSSGMLQQCAKRTSGQRPTPLLIQSDAAALPFIDGAFDAVFHFGGIQLFADPSAALRELSRVTKPGGRLFIGDEGFSPTLNVADWRRRLAVHLNPGFLRERPKIPQELTLERDEWIYAGFAWLWTLLRK